MMTKLFVMVSVYLSSLKNEEGQGMAEYGLILALIAVLLIGALSAIEGGLQTAFDAVSGGLTGATTP